MTPNEVWYLCAGLGSGVILGVVITCAVIAVGRKWVVPINEPTPEQLREREARRKVSEQVYAKQ